MPNQQKSIPNFSHLTHLMCSGCGKEYPAGNINTYCPDCQSPLLANYDLTVIRQGYHRDNFSVRPAGMWRWHELLPVQDPANCISLGEGDTPLLPLMGLGKKLGFPHLFLKDEGRNPTGSFKAREISVAISRAGELGIKKVLIPTIGNNGRAMAAYAAKAGLQAHIFMPTDTPPASVMESRMTGADVDLVEGMISESVGMAGETARTAGWFDLSTFKEPYRVEGKKTIGYELAEAFKWNLPDVILCPIGSGAGLVGIWKAFAELEALGWLDSNKRPRLVAVQAKGCAPIVKAFEMKAAFCDFWTNARTIASGLRVPKSFADTIILRDLYESHGTAISVSDEAILAAQHQIRETEGFSAGPEGAATLVALVKLLQQRWLQPEERIVLFNTGLGLK